MLQVILEIKPSQTAYEYSYRREAFQLFHMYKVISTIMWSKQTHQRETIQLFRMLQIIFAIHLSKSAYDESSSSCVECMKSFQLQVTLKALESITYVLEWSFIISLVYQVCNSESHKLRLAYAANEHSQLKEVHSIYHRSLNNGMLDYKCWI